MGGHHRGVDLAYLVAFGSWRYRRAAAYAIRALRGAGGFAGEVAVLSERPWRAPGGARVAVVDDPELRAEPKWLKLRAREILDLARYERVLFIDCDIVVRAPLADLLARCGHGRLVCTDDLRHTVGHGMCARCLEPDELAAHGERTMGINSGFFCATGTRLDAHLATWCDVQRACAGRPGPGFDQPALNAAMVRGLIPVDLHEGLMWFPGRDPRMERCRTDAPLVHFHGIGRHLSRLWRMRRCVRSLGC